MQATRRAPRSGSCQKSSVLVDQHLVHRTGDVDRALPHYRDAIRYREQQGNVHGASQTRFNVGLDLLQSGRPRDALEFARTALRGFESYGESAAAEIQRTRQLIGEIEGELEAPPPGRAQGAPGTER